MKRMKNTILALSVFSVFVMGSVYAQSNDNRVSDLLAKLAELQSQLNVVKSGGSSSNTNSGVVAQSSNLSGYVFTRNLSKGSRGADVKKLQELLNSDSATQIANTGVGSKGRETTYFGGLTKSAVIKFQNKYASKVLSPVGLKSGTGYVGPSTRKKLNELTALTVVSNSSNTIPASTKEEDNVNRNDSRVIPVSVIGNTFTVVSPRQPDFGFAIAGANRVPFTNIQLSAGSSSVVIESIYVKLAGFATRTVFDNVGLVDKNGNLIGNTRRLNSNKEVKLSPKIVIPARGSVILTVVADIPNNSTINNQTPRLEVFNVEGLVKGNRINSRTVVVGATKTINNAVSGELATVVVKRGSNDPSAARNKGVGTENYVFSAIRVDVDREDSVLKSVRFEQTGSANISDLANVSIHLDGKAYKTRNYGDYYVANFNDVIIKEGRFAEIDIRADIVDGTEKTVAFSIESATDINIAGRTYGSGVKPTIQSSSLGNSSAFYQGYTLTVKRGDIDAPVKYTLVNSQNIITGKDDQIFGGFEITANGEAYEIENLRLNFQSGTGYTSGKDDISNVRLYVLENGNERLVAGPEDLDNDTYVSFYDIVTLKKGKNILIVRGELRTTVGDNQKVRVIIPAATSFSTRIIGVDTNDTVSVSFDENSLQTMTVRSSSLVYEADSFLPSTTVGQGQSASQVGLIQLDASNSGETIRINNLPVRLTTSVRSPDEILSRCNVYERGKSSPFRGSDSLDLDGSVTGSNDYVFNLDDRLEIKSGRYITLEIRCDIKSTAPQGATIAFNTRALSYDGVESGRTSTTPTGTGLATLTVSQQGVSITKIQSTSDVDFAQEAKVADLGGFNFRSTNGNATLSKIQVKLLDTSSVALTSNTTGGRGLVKDSVVKIYNTNNQNSTTGTLIGTASFPTGNESSEINTNLNLPEKTDVYVKLLPVIRNVNSQNWGSAVKAQVSGFETRLADGINCSYGTVGVPTDNDSSCPNTTSYTSVLNSDLNGGYIGVQSAPEVKVVTSSTTRNSEFEFTVKNTGDNSPISFKRFTLVMSAGLSVNTVKVNNNNLTYTVSGSSINFTNPVQISSGSKAKIEVEFSGIVDNSNVELDYDATHANVTASGAGDFLWTDNLNGSNEANNSFFNSALIEKDSRRVTFNRN